MFYNDDNNKLPWNVPVNKKQGQKNVKVKYNANTHTKNYKKITVSLFFLFFS